MEIILFRAAITCMGFMYKNLGRMMGRSYEETVYILIKCFKNAESQMRVEIIITLEKVISLLVKLYLINFSNTFVINTNRFAVEWEVLWAIFIKIFIKL